MVSRGKKSVISEKDLLFKKRPKKSHKGQNGKLLIIGGSEDYAGAITLAGLAAYRAGVDWVTIAAPEKVAWAVNALSPDLVTKKLKGKIIGKQHKSLLFNLSKDHDAILIGNGIGTAPTTKQCVTELTKKIKKPLILDADVLKFVNLKNLDQTILTPHKKEFEALLKNAKLTKTNLKKNLNNNIILLKGPVDEIISKTKTKYNKTGNQGMTKAGTGDVLAGLTAGFVALGDNTFMAACKAAYLNGKIGDLLLKKRGYYSFIASDIIQDIKTVLTKLRKSK